MMHPSNDFCLPTSAFSYKFSLIPTCIQKKFLFLNGLSKTNSWGKNNKMNTSEKLDVCSRYMNNGKKLFLPVLLLVFLIGFSERVVAQPNFREGFDYDNGTISGTGWSSSNGAAVVDGRISYTSPADGETYVIWETGAFSKNCSTPFVIIGAPGGSGAGSAVFEYSTDNGSSWHVVSGSAVTADQIQLQLRVVNIAKDLIVTLDNVAIYQQLSAVLNSQTPACQEANNGTISVSGACGFDANYQYEWTGSPAGFTDPKAAEITGLEPGTYSVTITNDKGETATLGPITIARDNIPPTCTSYPPFTSLINYNYEYGTSIQTRSFSGYTYAGGEPKSSNETVNNLLDATYCNNLQVMIGARQSSASGEWTGADSIQVSYSDGTTWYTVLTDACKWSGTQSKETGPCDGNTTSTSSDWIDLPYASGKKDFQLRVICKSGSASRTYEVTQLRLRYNNTTGAADAGEPQGCDLLDATVKHTDSEMKWFCNDPLNLEFMFKRVWEITDECGNKTSRTQNISVGEPPSVEDLRDTTFDFCNYQNISIKGPIPTDNCPGNIQSLAWAVTPSGGVSPSSGSIDKPTGKYTIPQITFPQSSSGDATYTITWTVTDGAGFHSEVPQYVTIKQPIGISLTPVKFDFCSGESVRFTLSADGGGTGSYETTPVLIAPDGAWSGSNSISYTTSNLILGETTDITVKWKDITISGAGGIEGGCEVTRTFSNDNTSYMIHQNIKTLEVRRQ
jgi:hypothetical protein